MTEIQINQAVMLEWRDSDAVVVEKLAMHCAHELRGNQEMLLALGVSLLVTAVIVAAGGRRDRALSAAELAKADSILSLCERSMRRRLGDHPG